MGARSAAISSSHKATSGTVPSHPGASIPARSSPIESKMSPGRRPASRAAPRRTESEPTSAAETPLTLNEVLAKIANLLPEGYYECAGISKDTSRCKRQVKNKTYCHSHDRQLLDAISRNNNDKEFVTKAIIQIKSHNGPIDNKLADIRDALLLCRKWSETHVGNFSNLLRNIKKGPLEASERDQGPHALVSRSDHVYVCRGRTKDGKSCHNKTVGRFYCWRHDPEKITAEEVQMAFASISPHPQP